jgi:hypothetical protein
MSGGAEQQPAVSLPIPSELVEAIAERAADLVAERMAGSGGAANPGGGDRWLRGADAIAGYIGAPPSRVYALNSAGRIPVHHDGSALIARCSELDAWLLDGGAKRP